MHRQGIAHMDLKPSNVLLTKDGVPKVADFGLSVLLRKVPSISDQSSSGDDGMGSPVYMPPEFLSGMGTKNRRRDSFQKAHFARDVYSFAMLVWAVFSGEEPFPECRFGYEVVEMVLKRGIRPDLARVPKEIRGLLVRAWQTDPKARCDFEKISRKLGQVSGFLSGREDGF